MNTLISIILGLIQGLTEFLPVSSSGHLVLAEHFLGFQKPGISYETMLHLGSLLAVLIYFRKDIINLCKAIIRFNDKSLAPERRIILYMILATLVTGIVGLTLKDFFERLFTLPVYAAAFLSLTGVIVFFSDKCEKSEKNAAEMGVKKSLLIGLVQSLAILPGISRSGSTVAASLSLGIKRADAARFSFLLSIPAILGANIVHIKELSSLTSAQILPYTAGTLAAFISGYAVIAWLIKLIKQRKLKIFAYYCWLVSVLSVSLILMGY